jgi:hypothetical protein
MPFDLELLNFKIARTVRPETAVKEMEPAVATRQAERSPMFGKALLLRGVHKNPARLLRASSLSDLQRRRSNLETIGISRA